MGDPPTLPSPEQLQREIDALTIPADQSRILIVEDEAAIISALELLLEDYGFPIDTAATGELGLEVLATTPIRVALVDKNLPGATGIEVIQQGRLISPGTEFLLMTGHSSLDSAIAAIDAGASGYIVKPFDAAEVTTRLMFAMERNLLTYQNRQLLDSFRSAMREMFVLRTQHALDSELLDDSVRDRTLELEGQLATLDELLRAAHSVLQGVQQRLGSEPKLSRKFDGDLLERLTGVLERLQQALPPGAPSATP